MSSESGNVLTPDLGMRTRPSWIISYGTWGILASFILLFVAGMKIPFDNVVTAPVHLGSPPSLRATDGGHVHFLVPEGTLVSGGQKIAVIDRAQLVTSTVVYVSQNVALNIRPPQAATIEVGGRRIAATVTAILPAEVDGVPLRVNVSVPCPSNARGTFSIHTGRLGLLSKLLASRVP